jgi:hypothetical protein
MSPAPAGVSVPKGWYTTDIRSCLRETFPTSRTLADIATHSVSLAGTYPQPSALAEATKRQSAACVQASTQDVPVSSSFPRLALPCQRVGPAHQPHAQWFSSGHHILPT